jgi:hypothetical protein
MSPPVSNTTSDWEERRSSPCTRSDDTHTGRAERVESHTDIVRMLNFCPPPSVLVRQRPNFGGAAPAQLIANKSRSESLGSASVAPAAAAPAATSASTTSAPKPSGFAAEGVFAALGAQASPELVKKVNATFKFDVTKGDAKRSWLLDLKNGSGAVKDADEATKADCTIGIKDEDFVALMSGKLNAQQACQSHAAITHS